MVFIYIAGDFGSNFIIPIAVLKPTISLGFFLHMVGFEIDF